MRLLIYIFFTMIVINGCATQPVTTDLPDDQLAHIHGSYWGSFRWHKAAINGYDGEDFGLRPVAMLNLSPGEHSISASCFSGFGTMTGAFTVSNTIRFLAEAGHSYKVFCGAYGSGRTIWIQDQTTGKVVGGTPPT